MRPLLWCSGWLLVAVCFSPAAASERFPRLVGFEDRLIGFEGGQLCCAHRAGDGPTLVLIPGTFSDSRVFAKLIPHLKDDYNLMIIENRGLGKSWPPPENGSIKQCARDALLITKEMGARSFYIGGHSLGGMISLEVGRQAPNKLRGIISMEGWTNWQAARDGFDLEMKATLTEEELEEAAAYRKEVLAKWSERQVKSFGRIWRIWDGESFLKETTVPILEIYGDRGKARPTWEALRIPERDNIRLLWVENASHKLHTQKPKKVAGGINRFITEREAELRRR